MIRPSTKKGVNSEEVDTILRNLVPTPDNYLPTAIVFLKSSYFEDKDVVGGQNSWELGGVEMEFLRII